MSTDFTEVLTEEDRDAINTAVRALDISAYDKINLHKTLDCSTRSVQSMFAPGGDASGVNLIPTRVVGKPVSELPVADLYRLTLGRVLLGTVQRHEPDESNSDIRTDHAGGYEFLGDALEKVCGLLLGTQGKFYRLTTTAVKLEPDGSGGWNVLTETQIYPHWASGQNSPDEPEETDEWFEEGDGDEL